MLRANTLAAYIGQAYMYVVGILIIPLYIKYMGAEAYGLIGFFSIINLLIFSACLVITAVFSSSLARAQIQKILFFRSLS